MQCTSHTICPHPTSQSAILRVPTYRTDGCREQKKTSKAKSTSQRIGTPPGGLRPPLPVPGHAPTTHSTHLRPPPPLAEPSLPVSYPSPIPPAPDLPAPPPSAQMHKVNGSGRDVLFDQCRKTSTAGCGGAMGEAAGDVAIASSTTAVALASVSRIQFKFAVHES